VIPAFVALTFTAPFFRRVARPPEVMVTFLALLVDQVTDEVMLNEVEFE